MNVEAKVGHAHFSAHPVQRGCGPLPRVLRRRPKGEVLDLRGGACPAPTAGAFKSAHFTLSMLCTARMHAHLPLFVHILRGVMCFESWIDFAYLAEFHCYFHYVLVRTRIAKLLLRGGVH